MAIRPILTVPDPRLKQVSEPIAAVDDDIRALMDDMLDTMYDALGVGLAAIQIGVPKRVVVMDLTWGKQEDGSEGVRKPLYFANPEILWASDDIVPYEEGCLSVPEIYDAVDRPAKVRIRYLNRNNATVEEEVEGLLAVCIQHELDHLNGIVFIDHLSRLKRERAVAKVRKIKARAAA
jgi:peptide deformylase